MYVPLQGDLYWCSCHGVTYVLWRVVGYMKYDSPSTDLAE